MSLLTLVPFWYRWAAIGLLVIAVWGHGYVKGREAGQEKVDEITQQIQLERDKQSLQTAQKIIKDKGEVADVVQTFHSNISAINAYWLRQPKPAPRLSSDTAPAERTPPAESCPAPVGRDDQLRRECAETVAMFNACRDGWIRQESK